MVGRIMAWTRTWPARWPGGIAGAALSASALAIALHPAPAAALPAPDLGPGLVPAVLGFALALLASNWPRGRPLVREGGFLVAVAGIGLLLAHALTAVPLAVDLAFALVAAGCLAVAAVAPHPPPEFAVPALGDERGG